MKKEISSITTPRPGSAAAPDYGNADTDIKYGRYILIVFLVVLVAWAVLVRVDAAVYATGRVTVSGNRQEVQHKEGGVVTKINVREGDHVTKDQVLVELAGGTAEANAATYKAQYIALKAAEARLIAEQLGYRDLQEPAEFKTLSDSDREYAEEALRLQRQALQARQSTLGSQVSVLRQQQAQISEQIQGRRVQLSSNEKRIGLVNDELDGLLTLQAKGYVPSTRVRSVQQTAASLEGERGALNADIARSNEAIGEINMQRIGLEQDYRKQVVEELRETQSNLNTLAPQLRAAESEFNRTQLVAPATGKIVGLSAHTVGGVITPGQKVMDIVPDEAPLIIEALIQAKDGDDIRSGMDTQIRFSSLNERDLPLFKGKVMDVSADAFSDPNTGQAFYRATIEVDAQTLKTIDRTTHAQKQLKAGLPVEVIIPLKKRSLLEYLLEPLNQTLWRSFREH